MMPYVCATHPKCIFLPPPTGFITKKFQRSTAPYAIAVELVSNIRTGRYGGRSLVSTSPNRRITARYPGMDVFLTDILDAVRIVWSFEFM